MLRLRVSYPLAREYDVRAAGAINLASNESPYGPSPRVLRALRREVARIGSYPDPRATELKRAIGNYVGVEAGCVAIGNGSDELVDLACKAFLNPGERVLIPLPTFAMYELACRVNGGVPKFLELFNFEWRAAELKRALKGVKLVFIGRPNNPTGNGISLEGVRKLLVDGKLLIIDEAYAEFAEYSVARLAPKQKNLLVLRTFSKAFGLAGLRVGYAVGNPKLIEALEGIRAPFNVNRVAQAAAVAALRDKRYLCKVVAMIKQGRAYMRRELTKLGFKVLPSDANFLMVDVSPFGLDASEICDFLSERKIFVRDLSNFRGTGSNYVRITVGTPRQNGRLVGALRKLKGGR
jgi:histidinol-phosphate aminotransferase